MATPAKGRFSQWTPPVIQEGQPTKWNWVVQGVEQFILGKHTDIGAFTYINAQRGVEIQDDVQIGSHCAIYSRSTIDGKEGKVTIKKNARIGTHTVVMPGVTIGKNAVIGACSFVNRDIPDDATAYGVPVRIVAKTK